ncbi:MAG: iron-containing alcohol dehydrogenase [Phycisphaeraceae bacterium]|nr:iron-containing alcohol dehydrogenase [Phycisphaeraceae bacterium]
MIQQVSTVDLRLPPRIRFGVDCIKDLAGDLVSAGYGRVLLVSCGGVAGVCDDLRVALAARDAAVEAYQPRDREPTIADFEAAAKALRGFNADAVVGVGGGSVLDLAKLLAAMLSGGQSIDDVFGADRLTRRDIYLTCVPTTAGTGSEVSPNAILLDEREQLKKGVVSRWLVPDAAYVDPRLTVSMPAHLTAATGLDALTHCIEAYANRFAHPLFDTFALEGVRLIGRQLERAYRDGDDLEARSAMALGSLYGGMCLGPVNTGAVHALSYPLGGEFHVPHGVANALLLPHVLAFNLPAAPQRYAAIARALGITDGDDETVAQAGIARLAELCRVCGIPRSLSQLDVPREVIGRLAASALTVQRLLVRNVRHVSLSDAEQIYRKAFAG